MVKHYTNPSKVAGTVVQTSNSQDLVETPSYSASHPDPSYLQMSLCRWKSPPVVKELTLILCSGTGENQPNRNMFCSSEHSVFNCLLTLPKTPIRTFWGICDKHLSQFVSISPNYVLKFCPVLSVSTVPMMSQAGAWLQVPVLWQVMRVASPVSWYPSSHLKYATDPYVVPDGVSAMPLTGAGSPQSERYNPKNTLQ